ncbi:hypothetical protein PJN28_28570 [Mycobacterium kansasii]
MTTIIRASLFLMSVLAGMYSFAAFAANFEVDAYVAALIGILAAGGVILVDHVGADHDRRIADERSRVWERRDRESEGR